MAVQGHKVNGSKILRLGVFSHFFYTSNGKILTVINESTYRERITPTTTLKKIKPVAPAHTTYLP